MTSTETANHAVKIINVGISSKEELARTAEFGLLVENMEDC